MSIVKLLEATVPWDLPGDLPTRNGSHPPEIGWRAQNCWWLVFLFLDQPQGMGVSFQEGVPPLLDVVLKIGDLFCLISCGKGVGPAAGFLFGFP